MKIKSFSLLEIIIAIVVIAIIISFAIPKFNQINDKTNLFKLKSELSLIQEGISKIKSKNILLGNSFILDSLDDSNINKKDEQLFSKVINFSIISTNTNEKKVGSWAKISSNSYNFFLSSNSILFTLENGYFVCKSVENICKEVE